MHVVEEVEEGVVVGAVAGLARKFVHGRGPAGFCDGKNGQRVDGGDGFARFAIHPCARGLVHDVGFGVRTDFRHDGFLLFEEHAAGFQVAHAGDHGTLHDSAAFVVFDVAHPLLAWERDVFTETLFAEIANGVVVRIGEKVFDLGGGFYVIF